MASFMLLVLPLMGLMGSLVTAVDVVFVNGTNCSGHAMSGTRHIPYTTCLELAEFDLANSAYMANHSDDQVVTFFSDSFCKTEIGTSKPSEQCFEAHTGHIGSFKVDQIHPTNKTPLMTRDLEPYPAKLSNYRGVEFVPGVTDLTPSLISIGVGLGLLAAATAGTLGGTINGCRVAVTGISQGHPDGSSISGCLLPFITAICTFVAGNLLKGSVQAVRERWSARTGNVNPVRKRDLLDAYNADYVHGIMNGTGVAEHVGFASRDMTSGEQRSPVYEFDMGNGLKFHMSSFYDEASNDFVHHVRSAEGTSLNRRGAPWPYNSVRYDGGGFDFTYCRWNPSAPLTGYEGLTQDDAYNLFYDQVKCYYSEDQYSTAHSADVQLYNKGGDLIGEAMITGYTEGAGTVPGQCPRTSVAPVHEECIIE